MNGINDSLKLSANALGVFVTGMQVSAHNVANVSTDNFTPQRALYATGPAGRGVELDAVLPAARDLAAGVGNTEGIKEPTLMLPSGTDVAREIAHMIETRNAFEANAIAIRAADELTGIISDIIA